jgi:hypothetical protein
MKYTRRQNKRYEKMIARELAMAQDPVGFEKRRQENEARLERILLILCIPLVPTYFILQTWVLYMLVLLWHWLCR